MAIRTYGEYLQPVDELIEEFYPEERIITRRDLKLVATYAVVSALEKKLSDTIPEEISQSSEEGK